MLRSLIGYVRGAGLDARWVTIGGDSAAGDDDCGHVAEAQARPRSSPSVASPHSDP
jgi:hypothetical protein